MTILFLTTTIIAIVFGLLMHYLSQKIHQNQNQNEIFIEKINNHFPQLQCGECGYPGCRPYAAAIANDGVAINLCPPGGKKTVESLAHFLNVDIPLSPIPEEEKIAFIHTDKCVGCALCLPVCPTDAIIGSPRHLHVVIEDACVGCRLCLPPCPVDCIEMIPVNKKILYTPL